MAKMGEIRIIKKFLFFPCTIRNKQLWLKTVYIKQRFVAKITKTEDFFYWHNISFVTEKEYKEWTEKDL